ncbi:MAG: tRNA (guanosine(37)-N1)-methyltransferase TrmD [Ruminococcaceae bacterium]|nr:tRNA (guanosine(37)-N1)-methyltransferase TrmD [Oscillospiraceae bacterium]
MKIDIMTLFPEMCQRVLDESIIGRARKSGKVEISCVNIRDFSGNKHNKVDDTPYGGGMGMVMSATPIYNCFNSLYNPETEQKPHLIYLSPKGKTFTQKKAVELSKLDRIVLLCGHYEGVDQRVIDEIVDEEISVGDFVLTGGELPALTVADAVCRMLPGVLSDEVCFTEESHFEGLLEYPQYTKPDTWMERKVPEVLLSGHHANINKWRREKAIEETFKRRPEMLKDAKLSKKEQEFLKTLLKDVGTDQ